MYVAGIVAYDGTDYYGYQFQVGVPTIQGALDKVQPVITPAYRRWIEASRFVVLTTVGEEGTDASPRGDAGPVVRLVDEKTIWLPDWRGNERIDSLRNIVRDPRASLMFFVAGSDNVVRVNGKALVTADADLCASFARDGKTPRTVVVLELRASRCSRLSA